MKLIHLLFFLICTLSCQENPKKAEQVSPISLIILGTIQDGGSPHIGCTKACCKNLFYQPNINRQVVSLGLIDYQHKKKYLFEATPAMPLQMKKLKEYAPFSTIETPDGIFLTHAHIGHYSGLMYLGREAMNAKNIPVYAMPRMKIFLDSNGPWSQLVQLKNINIQVLTPTEGLILTPNIHIVPMIVPHRDEFSETVGYVISGPTKRALFIPDIDKWEKWDVNIIEAIAGVDYAFIDGTFYDGSELNTRNLSEIPHPFIVESMKKFSKLSASEKSKIYFIHFNHTNPALNPESEAAKSIITNGFHIAIMDMQFDL